MIHFSYLFDDEINIITAACDLDDDWSPSVDLQTRTVSGTELETKTKKHEP